MTPSVPNSWTTDPEYIDLLNYLIQETKYAKSPINIQQMVRNFKEKSGAPQTVGCLYMRIIRVRTWIHRFEHIDTKTKVKMMFALGALVNRKFLKELKKEALVEVDDENRITLYKANDGSFELKGRHRIFEKRSLINKYFKNKNDDDVLPKNEEEKEMGNLIEFITEKCDTADTPLSIRQLTKDFNKHFGISRARLAIYRRIKGYCREIQKTEFLDTSSEVKQLFCLGATLNSDFLKELRKDASVEVDNLNRITKYTANDGSLTLHGDHNQSAKMKLNWVRRRKSKNTVKKQCISSSDKDEESEADNEYSEEDSDEYSSEEIGSGFDSDDEIDPLKETEDLMEPSTDDLDNETPIRNRSPTEMPIDDNFDFDPPTERSYRSEETETIDVIGKENDPEITGNAEVEKRRIETPIKSKTSSSTSHALKTPKRKTDASAGSSTSKRTKRLSDKSTNPGGIEKDPNVSKTSKSTPHVMEAPIKKEYEEESQTSLKMILKALKSLILSLDNSKLSQFLMELDSKIEKTGRGVEVSNDEVILAMDLLIVKLSKHGALKSSEEAISLRDILLMLRTIILTLSFNGLEVILEKLKVNIEQLKVIDKKVPVSKLDSVLRSTLDNICN